MSIMHAIALAVHRRVVALAVHRRVVALAVP
jgi:hypothetical protein